MEIYKLEEPEEEKDTVLVGVGPPEEAGTQQEGQFQELELRVLNLKECDEHLKRTHLEQVQHWIDPALQVMFSTHAKQVKMGPGSE